MKLATYKDGSRDGQLLVVSRDLTSAHYATGIAERLQQVLDDWNFLSPQLQDLSDTLNYEMIGEAARAIAAEGHIGLVETFAERLAHACLADPRVTRARVRVEKPLALAPHAEAAGVEITLVRD